jgi:hypothetical protein
MCCCGKAVVNGEEGYSWDGKSFGIRKPFFPEIEDGDELLKDLPGRCGGIDSHSHDFRLVKRYSSLYLLVHHGGGSERINLRSYRPSSEIILGMSESDCYWMMETLYHIHSDAASDARQAEASKWQKAAATGRIKTRKQRGGNAVKVWIEAEIAAPLPDLPKLEPITTEVRKLNPDAWK